MQKCVHLNHTHLRQASKFLSGGGGGSKAKGHDNGKEQSMMSVQRLTYSNEGIGLVHTYVSSTRRYSMLVVPFLLCRLDQNSRRVDPFHYCSDH